MGRRLKNGVLAAGITSVALLGGAGAAIATPSASKTKGKKAPSLVVARLTLDAYNGNGRLDFRTPPVATPKLTKGKLYVATVQGTVSFYGAVDYLAIQSPFVRFCGVPQAAPQFPSAGGAGKVSNDAQFIFAQPTTTTCTALKKLPAPYPNFQLDNGFNYGHPPLLSRTPVRRPTRTHTYSYAITGQGRPANFALVDPDTRDDYGSFHITLRRAIASDCAGGQYKAFALKRRAVCLGDTANTKGTVPKVSNVKPVSLDQGPIARVLRNSDVVNGVNQELPNGALPLGEYAQVDGAPNRASATAERTALKANGFVSGAISAYTAPGLAALKSTAFHVKSAATRQAAFAATVQLAQTRAPSGTTASAAPDPVIPNATLIRFTAPAGGQGGAAIIALGKNGYVYALTARAQSGDVNAGQLETLLGSVIARG